MRGLLCGEPLGNQVTQTDAAGDVTSYGYGDSAFTSKMTTSTDPLGRTTTLAYDRDGNLINRQDPGGNCSTAPATGCTTYGYDPASEQVSTSYSDGTTPNVSNVAYDSDGQRTSMTDGTGTSSWVYDSLHRLVASTNGVSATVGYGYDLKGNLTTITYPGTIGSVTRGYDADGRLHTVTDWQRNTTTFNYDADANLISTTYPNGTTATNTVDAADRVLGILASKNATPTTPFLSFAYARDSANQVTRVTSTGVPADNHSYSYNQLNQLTGVDGALYAHSPADNLIGLTSGVSQSFDAADQLAGTAFPINQVGTRSTFDTGQTTSLSLGLPATTTVGDQILVAATVPTATSVSTPTGYSVVGTFASSGSSSAAKIALFRKTAIAGDTGVTITFGTKKSAKALTAIIYRGVDTANPIDAMSAGGTSGGTSVSTPGVTTTLAADQLVLFQGANNASASGSWTPPGGMATEMFQAAGTSLSAAIADKRLSGAGTTGSQTAGYSTPAELVAVLVALRPATTSYSYDARGNRTAISPSGGTALSLGYDQANRLTTYGTTTTYSYNGDGLRMSKTVSGAASQQTWDLAEGMPLLIVDGTVTYTTGPGGLPLEQVGPSGILYYLHDQLGSTRALVDQTGSVTATYTYGPYGAPSASTGGVINPFGYAGQDTDPESGMVYLRARYYDPGTAQFVSRDPLVGLTQSAFNYASGNPLNNLDDNGLCSINPFGHHSCLGSAVHWVKKNPWQTVAIVVGVVGLVTGVGALALPLLEAAPFVEGATLFGAGADSLGLVSTGTAVGSGILDLPKCAESLSLRNAACDGAIFNFAAAGLGAAASPIGKIAMEGLGLTQNSIQFALRGYAVASIAAGLFGTSYDAYNAVCNSK